MVKIDYMDLPLVGEGGHGRVYRLDETRCIKICYKRKDIEKEYRVLERVRQYPQFPIVYECKDNYMIREYVDGQNIKDYIRENGFDNDLAHELTSLIEVFIKTEMKRIDIRMQEVFVTKDKKIKILDTASYLTKKASYPRKMLKVLQKLGCRQQYMEFLMIYYPIFYREWSNKP